MLALKPAKELKSQRTKSIENILRQCWETKSYHQMDWWSRDGLKLGNKVKSQISGERNKRGEKARAPISVGHLETAANTCTRMPPHHPFPNRSSLFPSPSLPHADDFSWNGHGFSLLWHFLSPFETKLEVCCVKPSPSRLSYYPYSPSLSYKTYSTVFPFWASAYFFSFIQVSF